MSFAKINKSRTKFGSAFVLVLVMTFMVVPGFVSAASTTTSKANRVFYNPVPESFIPLSSFGSMIPEGYGKGINKLTINAGPEASDVIFLINNNNESGRTGTTFFETRKGPGNNDLSDFVKLSDSNNFDNIPAPALTNTLTMAFKGTNDSPLWVKVSIPACSSDGTFRIQAHPGGSVNQGNGPGVVVFVKCNKVPTVPQNCGYDYYGNPIACPQE